MELIHVKNIIGKIIKEQEEKNKLQKSSAGKGTSGRKIYSQMDEGAFKSILSRELKKEGFDDDVVQGIPPLVWVAIGYYFLEHYGEGEGEGDGDDNGTPV
jgi:hypothetical protein